LSPSKRVGWLGVDYFPEFFVQEISAYLCVPLVFKQNKFWATSISVREAKMTQKIWIDLKKNERNWQSGQIRWAREGLEAPKLLCAIFKPKQKERKLESALSEVMKTKVTLGEIKIFWPFRYNLAPIKLKHEGSV